ADGAALTLTYDAAGRVSGFSAAAGPGRLPVAPHDFVYDGAGRLVRAHAGGSVVRRRFDSLDRLVEDRFDGRTFRREFDDATRVYRLHYPDGTKEEHSWDVLGRVEQIKRGGTTLAVQYRGSARVARLNCGNGVQSNWVHDQEG